MKFIEYKIGNLSHRKFKISVDENGFGRVFVGETLPLLGFVSDRAGQNEQGCKIDWQLAENRFPTGKIEVQSTEDIHAHSRHLGSPFASAPKCQRVQFIRVSRVASQQIRFAIQDHRPSLFAVKVRDLELKMKARRVRFDPVAVGRGSKNKGMSPLGVEDVELQLRNMSEQISKY